MDRREFLRKAAFFLGLGLSGCMKSSGIVYPKNPLVKKIMIDASRVVGIINPNHWANVGYDPIYAGTVRFKEAWKEIGRKRLFRHVRCHNMFSDARGRGGKVYGCGIYSEDENGNPLYDWRCIDEVLDTFVRAGTRPILECDFMPDALAFGEIERNYGGGATNPPCDYKKWRDLIFSTVRHCEASYGKEEVRGWYWEVWNEPDLKTYFLDAPDRENFSPESLDTFLKMYDFFVDGAKGADPYVRVGGPGIAGHEGFFRTFLDHCVNGRNFVTGERGTRIDFVSWHCYGSIKGILEKDRKFIDIVKGYGLRSELHQNEWGQAIRRDGDKDYRESFFSTYEACFLAKMVCGRYERLPELDMFLRWGQVADFGLGWRNMSQIRDSGIAKFPVFLAYEMLSMLGECRIALSGASLDDDVFGLAARSTDGVQVLIYNFQEGNFEGGADADVQIEITNMPFDKASFRHYRIDRTHSKKNELEIVEEGVRDARNGVATMKTTMTPNSLSLLSFKEGG